MFFKSQEEKEQQRATIAKELKRLTDEVARKIDEEGIGADLDELNEKIKRKTQELNEITKSLTAR